MKINYSKILQNNMKNVLKDVLYEIEKNGLQDNHHLYITFNTKNKNIFLENWIKKKFPQEMTIVIQYEYWDLKVLNNKFEIYLSFNNKKTKLSIPFDSVISFADPYANFGLKLDFKNSKIKKEKNNKNKDNIIDFNKFKKLT